MYEESANINVFFCYTRQDYHITKEINNTIIKSGYTSFIDVDYLLPGCDFVNTIQENIIKSKICICIISKHSARSSWFIKEMSYATSIGKTIIPIKVDDAPIDDSISSILGHIQYLAWKPKYTENILNSLIKDYINRDNDVVIPSRASADIDNEIQRLNNYVPQKTECDIFISYRREGGRDCARTIKLKLHELGYKHIFFDYSSIRDGVFNTQILDAIYSCKDFLLLLSPNSMDRCINSYDWVAREIRTAFKYSRKIIPITMQDNFEWPESCPKDLKRIQELQYHKLLVDEYFDVSVARLSERLETSIENKLTLMTEQQFYYKIASSIKCKVYIDDKECFVIDKDGFKKVPLPKGEYFVRFVDYENNQEILKKIVCIDSDKAEML